MKFWKSKSGMVMAEALVAVTLMAVGAIVMGALINNAVSANRISKEYLLGHNLATEAIEGVKNIRDTNWLLQPLNPDCWLRLNPAGSPCTAVAQVDSYIAIEQNGAWRLVRADAEGLDLENGSTGAIDYLLYTDPSTGQYVDSDTAAGLPGGGEESIFYRSVDFLVIDPEAALVEVKVQWVSESKVRSIERRVQLYNYL